MKIHSIFLSFSRTSFVRIFYQKMIACNLVILPFILIMSLSMEAGCHRRFQTTKAPYHHGSTKMNQIGLKLHQGIHHYLTSFELSLSFYAHINVNALRYNLSLLPVRTINNLIQNIYVEESLQFVFKESNCQEYK